MALRGRGFAAVIEPLAHRRNSDSETATAREHRSDAVSLRHHLAALKGPREKDPVAPSLRLEGPLATSAALWLSAHKCGGCFTACAAGDPGAVGLVAQRRCAEPATPVAASAPLSAQRGRGTRRSLRHGTGSGRRGRHPAGSGPEGTKQEYAQALVVLPKTAGTGEMRVAASRGLGGLRTVL
jgi:hypothetical protein